ncbi:MAG: UvrD-helicase domain-containing protein [Eubacteriales bacterium]
MPQFTQSQSAAINDTGNSVIVSAGAGSGKTTVMTERILRALLSGRDISRCLIVTFTRAAAADLRGKLYRGLMKAAAENPSDRHVARQLMLLPSADISTVHAFCFSQIRRSFADLGITPDIRAADETESAVMINEIMDKALCDSYADGDKDFLSLADALYGKKSDLRLCEAVKKLYSVLRVYPDPDSLLSGHIFELERELESGDFNTTSCAALLRDEINKLIHSLRDNTEELISYAASAGADACLPVLGSISDQLDTVIAALSADWDTLVSAADAVSFPGLPKKSDEAVKKGKEAISGEWKKIRKKYLCRSAAVNTADMRRTLTLLKAARSLIRRFDSMYTAAKKSAGIIDFADQEHMMLELLERDGKPTQLCLSLRDSYDELYIDEYQDINPLQDRIFTLLSNGRNRFMVGDVKQSIYRFRSAHPDIFIGYRDTFGTPDFPGTARVTLRENFRCDKPIIDFANAVFGGVPGLCEAMNYPEESLIFAKSDPSGNAPVTVAAIMRNDGETASDLREREAEYIASEIERIVSSEVLCDGKRIGYGDIAVLFSALKSNSYIYTRVFADRGIPCHTEHTEGFAEQPEVLLAVSALRAVDNPTDDISLASLLRSPICLFTADELARIRGCFDGDCLYDCLLAASGIASPHEKGRVYRADKPVSALKRSGRQLFIARRGSGVTADTAGKCRGFLRRLREWRSVSEGMPSHRFIWYLYAESGLASAVLGEKNGERKYRSLMMLYEYARRYEEDSYKGLSAFLRWFSDSEGLSDAVSPDDGGDCVHFMTVHHSKGLEYPVVFLADADRDFTPRAQGDFIVRSDSAAVKFSEHNGMVSRSNCLYDACLIREYREETAEEARKLYVALTRARERLYVVGCPDLLPEKGSVNMYSAKSHFDWIIGAVGDASGDGLRFISVPRQTGEPSAPSDRVKVFPPIPEGLAEKLSFVYPGEGASLPSKIAVSEIRPGLLDTDEYERTVSQSIILRRPAFASDGSGTASDRGTANHVFMQFCSFGSVVRDGVCAEADRLVSLGFITPAQRELLNVGELDRFFGSGLFAEMRSSRDCRREMRFSVSESDTAVGGSGSGRILVQGVIDCFFLMPDGTYTVVDYKTDRVRSAEALIARHRAQISFYRRAVERMTGKPVSRTLLYSFCLGREIEVE